MSTMLSNSIKDNVEAYSSEVKEQIGLGRQNEFSSSKERENQDKMLIYASFLPREKVKSANSHMPWLQKIIKSTLGKEERSLKSIQKEEKMSTVRGIKMEMCEDSYISYSSRRVELKDNALSANQSHQFILKPLNDLKNE